MESGHLDFCTYKSFLDYRVDFWCVSRGDGKKSLYSADIRYSKRSGPYFVNDYYVEPQEKDLADFHIDRVGEWIFINGGWTLDSSGHPVAYDIVHGTSNVLEFLLGDK